MKRLIVTVTILLITTSAVLIADKPGTFEEAKALSKQTGKPILIEFTRSGCEYCEKAARDANSNQTIQQGLNSVVHFSLNAREDEGLKLSEEYYIGIWFPLYILTDSEGNVITRWSGYVSASLFLGDLRKALSDLTTIDARIARNNEKPNPEDTKFLATYYNDSHEYTKAIEMYNLAETIDTRGVLEYSYNIFQCTANLVWTDSLGMSDVYRAADIVLQSDRKVINNITGVASIMTRVARKRGDYSNLSKYLQAGIDATVGSSNKNMKSKYDNFIFEKIICIENDTLQALNIKKNSLGMDWDSNPEKYYAFSKWCLDKKINLDEAQKFAGMAVKRSKPGKMKAMVLETLADIQAANGDTASAIANLEQAEFEDPDDDKYSRKIDTLQGISIEDYR